MCQGSERLVEVSHRNGGVMQVDGEHRRKSSDTCEDATGNGAGGRIRRWPTTGDGSSLDLALLGVRRLFHSPGPVRFPAQSPGLALAEEDRGTEDRGDDRQRQ